MGSGSRIDRATGRKVREAGKLRGGRAGAIRRKSDGRATPDEKRVDQKRRQKTQSGAIKASNKKSAEREQKWKVARNQSEIRAKSWWN